MKKTPIIIAVCIIVAGFFLARSCSLGAKYEAMKDQYEAYRLIAKADNEMKMRAIEEANRVILARDAEIRRFLAEVAENDKVLSETQQSLHNLQQLEPTIQDKDELILNLRGQIFKLTEMFTLSQNTVASQRAIISNWEEKYNAQVKISEAWKAQYENELHLRVAAEGLITTLEGKVKVARLKGRAWTIVAIAAGGYVGYRLIERAVSK